MNSPKLTCEKLNKSFKSGSSISTVLREISLTIESASLTALIGPSGSGKSTLLNILAALDRPDSGSITIDGVEISNLSPDAAADFRLHRIGFVFQFFNLLPTLSVIENVAIPQYLADKKASEVQELANQMLALVDLGDKAGRYPHELSGGEVQRVAIARSLVNRPSIIFADEPTGNLDQENGEKIMRLFRSLIDSQGVTIVMATHDQGHAKLANRTYSLNQGRLLS
jgi:putative ABC transport system ATP-binding protein